LRGFFLPASAHTWPTAKSVRESPSKASAFTLPGSLARTPGVVLPCEDYAAAALLSRQYRLAFDVDERIDCVEGERFSQRWR
jgi:hypothetical protein